MFLNRSRIYKFYAFNNAFCQYIFYFPQTVFSNKQELTLFGK